VDCVMDVDVHGVRVPGGGNMHSIICIRTPPRSGMWGANEERPKREEHSLCGLPSRSSIAAHIWINKLHFYSLSIKV
jgi:hypothetical protein